MRACKCTSHVFVYLLITVVICRRASDTSLFHLCPYLKQIRLLRAHLFLYQSASFEAVCTNFMH